VTVRVTRKRRSRRYQRHRLARRALLVFVCACFTLAFSAVALRYLTPSLFHEAQNAEPDRKTAEASRNLFLASQEQALRDREGRTVYKYSVVPGGVRTVQELRWAAEHDPVVRAHYAGFDYDHAHVVKLVLARTAYISYRIGNKLYWTRHRVSLKKGETVITDGKMTARTRCANRVEEMPQQATSESEPPAERFDESVQPQPGTALSTPPVPFQSALMNRSPVAGLGPAAPLTTLDPIANGGVTPVLPGTLPQVCGIGVQKKPKHANGAATVPLASAENEKKKKKNVDPCGPGGGGTEVPEPATWVLMASGAGTLFLKARRKFSRSTADQDK
jgi:hypothetical protein